MPKKKKKAKNKKEVKGQLGKKKETAREKMIGQTIGYRYDVNLLPDYSRIGFTFHHISNAGLDDRNPGEESILVLYSIPIAKLF